MYELMPGSICVLFVTISDQTKQYKQQKTNVYEVNINFVLCALSTILYDFNLEN